jgi:hypothetical protein
MNRQRTQQRRVAIYFQRNAAHDLALRVFERPQLGQIVGHADRWQLHQRQQLANLGLVGWWTWLDRVAQLVKQSLMQIFKASRRHNHHGVAGRGPLDQRIDDLLGVAIARAGTPRLRMSAASFSTSSRLPGGAFSGRWTAPTTISSAAASASANSCWNTAVRLVAERGSKTAIRRPVPKRPRRPRSVSRIAVG